MSDVSDEITWPRAVPLERVLAVADPLLDNPWDLDEPVTADLVARVYEIPPCTHDHPPLLRSECSVCNARRIAWFVEHGVPTDDPHPVSFDFGCLGWEPDWPLIDGNHRVAAAKIRGDETIIVDVTGDLDVAEDLLLGTTSVVE